MGPTALALPVWLWSDPEHVFWMRLMLALAGGIWVAATAVAGFFLFRWRERARLDEEVKAGLRKQILEALIVVSQAWLAHYTAHNEAARHRTLLEKTEDLSAAENIKALLNAAEAREQEEFGRLNDLIVAKGMLIPDFILDAYFRYATAPVGTKQRRRGFRQMELAFKSFLPRMHISLGPFGRLRFLLGTWSGWEKEKEDEA